jgi:hypothetical protein
MVSMSAFQAEGASSNLARRCATQSQQEPCAVKVASTVLWGGKQSCLPIPSAEQRARKLARTALRGGKAINASLQCKQYRPLSHLAKPTCPLACLNSYGALTPSLRDNSVAQAMGGTIVKIKDVAEKAEKSMPPPALELLSMWAIAQAFSSYREVWH